MKSIIKYIAVLLLLIACDIFFFVHRQDIKSIEKFMNEDYYEYIENKDKYTLTTGRVTQIIEPRKNHSIEEDPGKFLGSTDTWYCIIEFETRDGKVISDRTFLADTDNDEIGRSVEIAYYDRPDLQGHIKATRTEYIKDLKSLRKNLIMIIIFSAASIAAGVFTAIKIRSAM